MSIKLGPINLVQGVEKFSERIMQEKEKRRQVELLPFGVKYLDDALNGIRRDDFIVFTVRTGGGKTQLASTIAMHNASIGKRVFFFALEAANFEIERRIKYQILSHVYYNVLNKSAINLNFQDWYDGLIKDDEILEAEDLIEKKWACDYETLSIIYRNNSSYTVEDFERQLFAYKDRADLFVLDHLHFFDFDEKNENLAYKKIVKKISDVSQILNKPVVMVVHLRKSDRGSRTLIPSEEDVHGSSDIVKIPTKIITVAKATNIERSQEMIQSKQWPTYMRIAKNRSDMARTFYPAVVLFSQKKSRYESKYKIGQLNYDETEWKETHFKDWPEWAKKNGNTGIWEENRL